MLPRCANLISIYLLPNFLPERRIIVPKSNKSSNSLFSFSGFNFQESYPSLILGAIILIILGLLVANFFSRRGDEEIGIGEQVEQTIEEAEPTEGSQYTIRENDSLSKISEAVYGEQDYWPQLAGINNISNPNRILVGNTLEIPAKDELEPVAVQETLATTYVVQEGDTFFLIAEKVYSDGSRWGDLFRANGSRRLPNGNPLVFAGSTITIPR